MSFPHLVVVPNKYYKEHPLRGGNSLPTTLDELTWTTCCAKRGGGDADASRSVVEMGRDKTPLKFGDANSSDSGDSDVLISGDPNVSMDVTGW